MVYFSYLMAFIFIYCVRGVAVSAVVISFLEDFTRNFSALGQDKNDNKNITINEFKVRLNS